VELVGFDEQHAIEDVLFQNVVFNGKPLSRSGVRVNTFVKQLVITP